MAAGEDDTGARSGGPPPLDEAGVAAYWDRNAGRWAEEVRAGYDRYRELYTFPAFLAFMPALDGRRVIDLGCGEGTNTRAFAERGGRLTGVDLSNELIGLARAAEAKQPLGIRYAVASFTALSDFPAESFDVALSTMALMDGPDVAAALKEAWRVLAPGGELCFSVLHPCFMTRGFQWLRGRDGGYAGICVSDYFDRRPFVDRFDFSKKPDAARAAPEDRFEVPRFPSTLSDYLNAVCDAGFRLSAIAEPRPDDALAREHPWLARWHRHAPLILMVRAAKA